MLPSNGEHISFGCWGPAQCCHPYFQSRVRKHQCPHAQRWQSLSKSPCSSYLESVPALWTWRMEGMDWGYPDPLPPSTEPSAYRGSSNTGVTRGCDFISHIKSLLCCLEKHYCYVLISDERTHAWVGISPSTRKALKTRWLPCLFNVYNLALATTVGNPGFF